MHGFRKKQDKNTVRQLVLFFCFNKNNGLRIVKNKRPPFTSLRKGKCAFVIAVTFLKIGRENNAFVRGAIHYGKALA
jgi:hypothetical protein